MEETTAGGAARRTGEVARTLWARVLILFHTLRIEPPEMLSILCALSWWLPLALYPDYLQSSPYLMAVAQVMPSPVLYGVTTALFAYQLVCLLFGGFPSVALRSATAERRWLKARMEGVRASIFVWAAMTALLSLRGVLTTGAVYHGGVAVLCGWGLYLMDYRVREHKAERELREIRAQVCESLFREGGMTTETGR